MNSSTTHGFIARKLMMHQLITKDGDFITVTYLQAAPNVVTAIKTKAKNGYIALQLAAPKPTEKQTNKAQKKLMATANIKGAWKIKEIPNMTGFKVADKVTAEIFPIGSYVDVCGVTKGKGFQGVIKRFGFGRGPMSHGSHHHRAPGSIGYSKAERVWKGAKLPGHMGAVQRTTQNLEVIQYLPEDQLIVIKGMVPGPNRGWIVITNSIRGKPTKKSPTVLFDYATMKLGLATPEKKNSNNK